MTASPERTESVTLWRKKPIVIEAMRLLRSDENEVRAWIEGSGGECLSWLKPSIGGHQGFSGLHIATLEGQVSATYGDWIIRGIKGEFYPCKPDIFEATYEPADAAPPISREDLEIVCVNAERWAKSLLIIRADKSAADALAAVARLREGMRT